ncbi:hypothetical protein N7452_005559 [Penicillium brevicompactum]|uniref:Uncharacterized protein n=1 Tax=Penicillium brevicompactum TaxID=5074 RepID=A0A9W9QJ25_PENBR|nr:hypothetical protein N7452_005559 [Penicillium brevicompactum]
MKPPANDSFSQPESYIDRTYASRPGLKFKRQLRLKGARWRAITSVFHKTPVSSHRGCQENMASNFQNECPSEDRSLTPITGVPPAKEKPPPDPNMNNPRYILNRACIYERYLPGDAYITAHVERLQHGYYSNPGVSDHDSHHVDFLAIGFTLHSPNTLSHRFKSAKIRVSVRGSREYSNSHHHPYGYPPGNPRFLMHAPHLIYGTVSPETMEWTFSLAGSLGVSEMPVSASIIPSGSINSRYRRYEMMRIQGSARTLKSERGPSFDIEAGEIVWSLEENDLQRSGLPREFTFVMLVHKPAADSRVNLSMDIEPVIAAKMGSYPSPMLKLPAFQPLARRGIDFRQEIGQRFEPTSPRGYNFAELASMFDEYIAMPGRKFSRQMQIPPEPPLPDNHFQGTYPGQYGQLNPYQQQLQSQNMALTNNGINLQNSLLQTTLQNLWRSRGRDQGDEQPQPPLRAQPQPQPCPPRMNFPNTESPENTMTLNLHLHVDSGTATQFAHLARAKSPARDFSREPSGPNPDSMTETDNRPRGVSLEEIHEDGVQENERRLARLQRAREPMREAVASDGEDEPRQPGRFDHARARRGIMSMANSPLSASLLSALSEG